MFGKKKEAVGAPSAGAAAVATKAEKLTGPRRMSQLPGMVGKCLQTEYKMKPDFLEYLRAIIRKSPKSATAFDCLIYDAEGVEGAGVQVKNYTSLEGRADLILYEGWFDEAAKKVELREIRKPVYEVPLFTEAEILQKIQSLSQPGSSVFFYLSQAPASGGPLGRGAAVVELNASGKGKKYILSASNVIGTELGTNRQKLIMTDKAQELAKWIKERHNKRAY